MMQKKQPLVQVSTLAALGCALFACSSPRFVMVETKLVDSTRDERASVLPSSGHRAPGAASVLAVVPPDWCSNQAAAGLTGIAEAAPAASPQKNGTRATGESAAAKRGQDAVALLAMRCGVELAEMERGLVRAGYPVVSWVTLYSLTSGASTNLREAARALGITSLVMVNSIEKVWISPGRDARLERRYFASGFAGKVGRALPLGAPDRTAIKALVADDEARFFTGRRRGILLDVSVVDVQTGQATWFYRWQKPSPVDVAQKLRVLTVQRPDDMRWQRIRASTGTEESGGAKHTAVEIIAYSTSRANAADDSAEYFQLLQDVVDDCVRELSGTARPPDRVQGGSSVIERKGK